MNDTTAIILCVWAISLYIVSRQYDEDDKLSVWKVIFLVIIAPLIALHKIFSIIAIMVLIKLRHSR